MSVRRRSHSAASPALCSSATAMIALVAVAAMMTSSVHASPVRGQGDVRQTIVEAAKVRAAVAAVAAAARQMVEGERLAQAVRVDWRLCVVPAVEPLLVPATIATLPPAIPPLREHLLDLPPPVRA